ncbi:MAG: HAMP domain-containing protein, partial [Bacteroidales bacterium]
MNIKTKMTLTIGLLVLMIILLVVVSMVNMQILTATEPDTPAAGIGLKRAFVWVSCVGAIGIASGIVILFRLPSAISKPIKEIANGIQEIANHNYEKRLDLDSNQEFAIVSKNFNRMAKRLADYHVSALSE